VADRLSRAAGLRQVRGTMSLREFAAFLVTHGLGEGELSRQRLSRVERGEIDLPPRLWTGVIAALRAAGVPAERLAPLMPVAEPVIHPVPPSEPGLRRAQWSRLLTGLPGNRWWQQPTTILARVAGPRWIREYHAMAARYGVDAEGQRQDVLRRLASRATWSARPDDAVAVHGDESTRSIRVGSGELFVVELTLRNTGAVPWRDRLLYRLGTTVSSSSPFLPGLLPVPDTEPGATARIVVPGRAQHFPNLAVISFAMVFADCAPSLPGVVRCFVDTREENRFDHTLDLPDGIR
jgi:hypothetical protein